MKQKMGKMVGGLALIVVIAGSSGCRGVRYSSHSVGNGQVTTLTYDATKRAIKVLYQPSANTNAAAMLLGELQLLQAALQKRPRTPEVLREIKQLRENINAINAATARPIILAEPPPDAATQLSANLSGTFDSLNLTKAEIVETLSILSKLQSENHAIRDALYRLNEGAVMEPKLFDPYPPNADGTSAYERIFIQILKSAAQIATASTNISTSPAPKEKGTNVVSTSAKP